MYIQYETTVKIYINDHLSNDQVTLQYQTYKDLVSQLRMYLEEKYGNIQYHLLGEEAYIDLYYYADYLNAINIIVYDENIHMSVYINYQAYYINKETQTILAIPTYVGQFAHLFSYYQNQRGDILTTSLILEPNDTFEPVYEIELSIVSDVHTYEGMLSLTLDDILYGDMLHSRLLDNRF